MATSEFTQTGGDESLRFSVVIPAYNSETCISRAINSVLGQTLKAREVIVVDDCSTDNTPEIIEQYGSKVIFLRTEINSGPSVARNMGIRASTGEWIAFLDADDEWMPDKLKAQNQLINENKDIKWCSSNYLLDDGVHRHPAVRPERVIRRADGPGCFDNYFRARVNGDCHICTITTAIQKELIDEVGLFDKDLIRHQDWDLWWRIAHRYPKAGYIAEPLAIRYLNIETQDSARRRVEAKRGDLLRKIISAHLRLADKHGTLDSFEPFAFFRLRNSVLMMLFLGYKQEARETIAQFHHLFKLHWRAGVYLLTIFPRLTAFLVRRVVYVAELAGIVDQASRRWSFLKHKK